MSAFRVHWGGVTTLDADNEEHAKQLFFMFLREHCDSEVSVYDVEAVPPEQDATLRETFIRLGQHR